MLRRSESAASCIALFKPALALILVPGLSRVPRPERVICLMFLFSSAIAFGRIMSYRRFASLVSILRRLAFCFLPAFPGPSEQTSLPLGTAPLELCLFSVLALTNYRCRLVVVKDLSCAERQVSFDAIVYAEYVVYRIDGLGRGRIRIFHGYLEMERITALLQRAVQASAFPSNFNELKRSDIQIVGHRLPCSQN